MESGSTAASAPMVKLPAGTMTVAGTPSLARGGATPAPTAGRPSFCAGLRNGARATAANRAVVASRRGFEINIVRLHFLQLLQVRLKRAKIRARGDALAVHQQRQSLALVVARSGCVPQDGEQVVVVRQRIDGKVGPLAGWEQRVQDDAIVR